MPANRLLPLRSSVDRGEGANVVGIREDAADDVFEALSASTAREILMALYQEPDTASGVADVVDTSLQNATYHLEKLVDAELVEVADTWYSEQGREMKVYAPANESLVLFASDEASKASLKDRLLRVLGAVGVLGLVSIVVQRLLVGQLGRASQSGETAQPSASGDTFQMTTDGAASGATDAAASGVGVPPGAVFFAGGLLVLTLVLGYAWWRSR
ncbi:ArsR/SmtB family transcription factor [Halobacterium zhouii]|uniref:ArsR/SmtB family transcription factor n=1 Tax=Halobacterium zhouii TaxID=2902624 RepID=UPI001E29254D|nr:helix-turn-helix domain-containing protein [Halobacterium zhouii]